MSVTRRGTTIVGGVALALAAAAIPPASADGTEPSSRKPGPLGWVLASAPRAPHPWHKYGEFTFGGGFGWSQYQDHIPPNDDGSLSAIDAKDGGTSWLAGAVSAKVEATGWSYSGLVRIPVKPRWVMLARLGVLSWSSAETFTENGGTIVTKETDTGSTALMGLGFEYDIYSQDHFWLRTEFTRAQVDNDELPVLGLNGSLVFHY